MSLPNKPYEYMSAGLPLLSSLHGELETLIATERIGLQYQTGDVASLVEGIRWLASHPVDRAAMGTRARKLFDERFSDKIVYSGFAQHLEKIVSLTRYPLIPSEGQLCQ